MNKNTDIIIKENNISVDEYLKSQEPLIQKLLPTAGITADRMISVVYNCFQKVPDLLKCDVHSLTGAVLASAQYGLQPGVECHILPYNKYDKGKLVATNATFIMDYKGVCTLLGRNENVIDINAYVVYENDFFDMTLGTKPIIIHKPCIKGERGEMIGAYCIIRQINGGETSLFMRKDEIEKIRETSSAWITAVKNDNKYEKEYGKKSDYNKNNTLWIKYQDEMWKKTVIKRISKTLNLTGTSRILLQNDEAILKYNEKAKSEDDIIEADFSIDQEEIKPEIPVYNPSPKLETPAEVIEVEQVAAELVQEKSMKDLENIAKSLKSEIDKMDNTNINKVYSKVDAFGNNKLIAYFKKKATNYELIDDIWVLKSIEPENPVIQASKDLVNKMNMNVDPCQIPDYKE